jgi:uncharacterized membrane protein YtjA (UPF0391 family)
MRRSAPFSLSPGQFVPPEGDIFCGFSPGNRAELPFPVRIILAIRASRRCQILKEESVMLSWVVTFLVVALIAGVLGFGGIAGVSIEIAKTIFFIAVVLFLISAVIGLARGRTDV